VLESERGAADRAVAELTSAGHEVVRCHEAGAPAFPCRALDPDDGCPLRDRVVDVALTVRNRPRLQPAPQEDGVTCAVRQHVPLVVAGPNVMNPFEPWAVEVLDRTYNVVEACERAAVAPLPRHGGAAAAALSEVLARHDALVAAASVEVRRRDGRLHVEVHGADDLDHSLKSMASVRIAAALRAFDHDATGIDVTFG
jgi:hypothetical protein